MRFSMRRQAILAILTVAFIPLLTERAESIVYWTGLNGVERINADGSHRSDIPNLATFFPGGFIKTDGPSICGLAVTSTHIFWANRWGDAIGRADLDGGNVVEAFISGTDEPCGIAVDDGHIYWANRKGLSISRANLDGTAVDRRFIDIESRPCGVAVDDEHVYWGTAVGAGLSKADLDGTDVEESIIDTPGASCGVTVNETHIFWTDFSGTIGRASLNGEEANQHFITGAGAPCDLAVSEDRIYWANEGLPSRGSIGTANLDGTSVNQHFVADLPFPCGVAVDALAFEPPPGRLSRLSLGEVRRNTRRGVAFLAVDLPETGVFKADVRRGLQWNVFPDHILPGETGILVVNGGRKWVKIWPSSWGAKARRLRARLEHNGRVRVKVQITHTEPARLANTQTRWLTLVKRVGRR